MRSFLLTAVSLLALCLNLRAQDPYYESVPYEPMDSWPYLYSHFEEGAVRTTKGALLSYTTLNVCLDGKLHYIQGDRIMEADMSKVFTARVGENDVYVNVAGKMHKVLQETEQGHILMLRNVDYDELSKVDIGYGVASSTASRTNTSLAGLGIDNINGVNITSMTLNRAEQQKSTGKVIPVKEETFFLVKGQLIPATKRAVQEVAGKDACKAFFKEHKLKWNKAETLVPVIGFLYESINPE